MLHARGFYHPPTRIFTFAVRVWWVCFQVFLNTFIEIIRVFLVSFPPRLPSVSFGPVIIDTFRSLHVAAG